MAFPEYDREDSHLQLENFEDWACPQCFKTISASRPPVYNADNCSCVEASSHTVGGHVQSPEATTYEPEYQHYQETTFLYHQRPQSYASSSASVRWPEGPENDSPNLRLSNGNNYLPLVAAPGLNETEHRRRASFNSDMSYPMQRFLGDREVHQSVLYGTEHTEHSSSSKFLSQETHLQCSQKVKRGSPRSKLSLVSETSRSGEASIASWGMVDPLEGAGTWADGSRYAYTGEAYPMVMSGLTECTVFDDDDDE